MLSHLKLEWNSHVLKTSAKMLGRWLVQDGRVGKWESRTLTPVMQPGDPCLKTFTTCLLRNQGKLKVHHVLLIWNRQKKSEEKKIWYSTETLSIKHSLFKQSGLFMNLAWKNLGVLWLSFFLICDWVAFVHWYTSHAFSLCCRCVYFDSDTTGLQVSANCFILLLHFTIVKKHRKQVYL